MYFVSCFFFCKQKTAYEMRISDWSSDVCSSDLPFDLPGPALYVTVNRGGTVLPISAVPALSAGDELTVRADLPEDQGAKFLLLSEIGRASCRARVCQYV